MTLQQAIQNHNEEMSRAFDRIAREGLPEDYYAGKISYIETLKSFLLANNEKLAEKIKSIVTRWPEEVDTRERTLLEEKKLIESGLEKIAADREMIQTIEAHLENLHD